MKEPFKIFDYLNKAKISQRDRFILYLLGMLVYALALLVLMINSLTGLTLAKQFPDLLSTLVNQIIKFFF